MRINTNVSALTALGNLNKVQSSVSSSMEKLSSGFRINRAGDDAAGLGISNQLNADIRAMSQAARNAEQAGSVLQIMDGAAQNVSSILERMKELAAQAASDSVDAGARGKINNEFTALSSELDRIVSTTKFQGAALLNGSFGSKVNAGGTIDQTASTLKNSTNVGSIVASDTSKLQAVVGNISVAVATANSADTSVSGVTGANITVDTQSTLNGLTAGNLTFASVFDKTDVASSGANYVVDTTNVTGITFGTGSDALAVGTYSISAANGTNTNEVDITITGPGGFSQTATFVAGTDSTVSVTGGITLAFSGSLTQANAVSAFNGKDFNVTQSYNVSLSGGGATTQTQSLTDDGTAKSMSFSNFGLSVAAPTGSAASFDAKTIAVASAATMTLTGADANGALTQSIALNSNPASQALNFSTFGVTVNLGASATAAGLTTDVTGGASSIVQGSTRTAQFLVSSSQSYTTNDLVSLNTVDLTAQTLGVTTTNINLSTAAGAQAALATIDTALATVGNALGAIGAAENRISYASQNVATAIQNYTAANSVIKDVDMAAEMTTFSKNQILSQAGTAILAQANQIGAGVLQLLRG